MMEEPRDDFHHYYFTNIPYMVGSINVAFKVVRCSDI